MPQRGLYGFDTTDDGVLTDDADNRERLRRLFVDPGPINGRWGPGDPGDFDHGAWHILCHLAAGAGVLRTPEGLVWCGLTHDRAADTYEATLSRKVDGRTRSVPVASPEAQQILAGASVAAFVEGTSNGHIAARGAVDPPTAFNHWPRQQFDQDVASDEDGGTVWEHWCTTRDLRQENRYGPAVVGAYLTLVSALGGRFVAAVARGRRQHEHPVQLVALVRAGVLTAEEATWDTTPTSISPTAQQLFYEARPTESLRACEELTLLHSAPTYHMFSRRIDQWSTADDVRRDLSRQET